MVRKRSTRAGFRQRFAERALEAIGDAPAQFAAAIKADIEKLGRIINKAGIKAEL